MDTLVDVIVLLTSVAVGGVLTLLGLLYAVTVVLEACERTSEHGR